MKIGSLDATIPAICPLYQKERPPFMSTIATAMMPHILASIYHHPLITAEHLDQIIHLHSPVTYKKGEYLLQQGQQANEYYCLESGLIRSFALSTEGKDITTGFFGKNEIVIEVASLFMRIPTLENIQALTDCKCWKIDFAAFQQLFQSMQGFMEWGRTWMSGVLFATKQRSLSMITDSASQRYLRLVDEHPEVIQHAQLRYIASYLGITDSSLSRIRKECAS